MHYLVVAANGTKVGNSDQTRLSAGTYTVKGTMNSPQPCSYQQTYTLPDRDPIVIGYQYFPATCNSLGMNI